MAYELSTIGALGDAASGLPTGFAPAGWTVAPVVVPSPDVTYDAGALLAVGLACLLIGAGAVYAVEKGYL